MSQRETLPIHHRCRLRGPKEKPAHLAEAGVPKAGGARQDCIRQGRVGCSTSPRLRDQALRSLHALMAHRDRLPIRQRMLRTLAFLQQMLYLGTMRLCSIAMFATHAPAFVQLSDFHGAFRSPRDKLNLGHV